LLYSLVLSLYKDVVDVTIDKEKGRVVRSKKSFKTGAAIMFEIVIVFQEKYYLLKKHS
jgi:hypothetical protein